VTTGVHGTDVGGTHVGVGGILMICVTTVYGNLVS